MKKVYFGILILVIAIVLIISWFARKQVAINQTAKSSNQSSVKKTESIENKTDEKPVQQQKESKAIEPSSKKYFEIKELGIQFPVDVAVANDLTYIGDGSGAVILSAKQLTALGCDPRDGLMRLVRFEGKPDQETQFYFEHAGGVGLKQLDGFFVTYQEAQASCWGEGKNAYTEEKREIMVQTGDKVFAGFENVSALRK